MSSVTTDGTTQDRTSNAQNQLTSVGSSTLTYDANGNTTTDDLGHTLVYDAWNRLVEVKDGSTVLKTYAYDGLGRRITEAPNNANPTELYYSAASQVVEERIDAGSVYLHAQYVWSPVYVNAMVVRDYNFQGGGSGFDIAERTYVTQDANWNVTGLISQFTLPGDANGDGAVNGIDLGILAGNMFHNVSGGDAAGDFNHDGVVNGIDLGILSGNFYLTHSASWQVAEHFVYDGYGKFTVTNASWSTASVEYLGWNYTFQGMRYDAAIGDNFSLTRVYNPRTGTWLSQDPMGYVDGASLYQAVADNPINRVDSLGLYSVVVVIYVDTAGRPPTFNRAKVEANIRTMFSGVTPAAGNRFTISLVDEAASAVENHLGYKYNKAATGNTNWEYVPLVGFVPMIYHACTKRVEEWDGLVKWTSTRAKGATSGNVSEISPKAIEDEALLKGFTIDWDITFANFISHESIYHALANYSLHYDKGTDHFTTGTGDVTRLQTVPAWFAEKFLKDLEIN